MWHGAVLQCLVAHEYSMRQRVGKCAAWNIWSSPQGPLWRESCIFKKEGGEKKPIKWRGVKKQQQSASVHIIWLICFANLILRPAAPASTKQAEWMNSVCKLNPTEHHHQFFKHCVISNMYFARHSVCILINSFSNWRDSSQGDAQSKGVMLFLCCFRSEPSLNECITCVIMFGVAELYTSILLLCECEAVYEEKKGWRRDDFEEARGTKGALA